MIIGIWLKNMQELIVNKNWFLILLSFIFITFFSSLPQANTKKENIKKEALYKIRGATIAPDGSPWDNVTKEFLAAIKKNTNSQIKIRYFNSGILGGESALVKNLAENKIQFWGGSMGAFCLMVPELNIFELPFLFRNNKEVDYIYNNLEDEISKVMGIYNTSLYLITEVGWRSLATINKKVLLLDDLKGLRMRSQPNSFHLAMWKALMTKPFPVSIIETRSLSDFREFNNY